MEALKKIDNGQNSETYENNSWDGKNFNDGKGFLPIPNQIRFKLKKEKLTITQYELMNYFIDEIFGWKLKGVSVTIDKLSYRIGRCTKSVKAALKILRERKILIIKTGLGGRSNYYQINRFYFKSSLQGTIEKRGDFPPLPCSKKKTLTKEKRECVKKQDSVTCKKPYVEKPPENIHIDPDMSKKLQNFVICHMKRTDFWGRRVVSVKAYCNKYYDELMVEYNKHQEKERQKILEWEKERKKRKAEDVKTNGCIKNPGEFFKKIHRETLQSKGKDGLQTRDRVSGMSQKPKPVHEAALPCAQPRISEMVPVDQLQKYRSKTRKPAFKGKDNNSATLTPLFGFRWHGGEFQADSGWSNTRQDNSR